LEQLLSYNLFLHPEQFENISDKILETDEIWQQEVEALKSRIKNLSQCGQHKCINSFVSFKNRITSSNMSEWSWHQAGNLRVRGSNQGNLWLTPGCQNINIKWFLAKNSLHLINEFARRTLKDSKKCLKI